jgi:branched-chain amino acid transport system permease protein
MNKIVNSKIGLFFRSIREDEDAAAAMGVNVIRYKVLAFTISGFFAGLAGAFYGHYILLVSPHMMFIYEMGLIVSMVVIGGIESLIGPVFGAVILETLSEYLRVYGEYYRVIFGALLIITLKFSPRGLILPGFMALMRTFGIMGKVKADGGQYPKGEKH